MTHIGSTIFLCMAKPRGLNDQATTNLRSKVGCYFCNCICSWILRCQQNAEVQSLCLSWNSKCQMLNVAVTHPRWRSLLHGCKYCNLTRPWCCKATKLHHESTVRLFWLESFCWRRVTTAWRFPLLLPRQLWSTGQTITVCKHQNLVQRIRFASNNNELFF